MSAASLVREEVEYKAHRGRMDKEGPMYAIDDHDGEITNNTDVTSTPQAPTAPSFTPSPTRTSSKWRICLSWYSAPRLPAKPAKTGFAR